MHAGHQEEQSETTQLPNLVRNICRTAFWVKKVLPGGLEEPCKLPYVRGTAVLNLANTGGVCQKRPCLVVVQNGVEVLDPDGVHRAVQNNPGVLILIFRRTPPQHRKDPVGPVACCSVHSPKHLWRCDRLRNNAATLTKVCRVLGLM